MKTNRLLASAGSAACLFVGSMTLAHAVDSFSFEAGTGDRTNIVRGAVQWDWDSKWFQSNGTHFGGHWDLSGAFWKERRRLDISGNTNYFYDVGFTPVFRFQRDDKRGLYAEAAVGVHYLSELYKNGGKRLSTRFQFGDHVGFGYVFANNIDLGFRYQHFSNGSIKKPNSGVDFAVLRLAYRF